MKRTYSLWLTILVISVSNTVFAGGGNETSYFRKPYVFKKSNFYPFRKNSVKDDYEGYPNPFVTIQLGAFISFLNSNTALQLNPSNGQGTVINLRKDFNYKSPGYYPRVDLIFRVAKRHQIALSSFGIFRSKTVNLSRDIKFGDTTFVANSSATAKLQFYPVFLDYRFSIIKRPAWEVGVLVGGGVFYIHSSLKANLNEFAYSNSKTWYVPIALPGIHGSVYITKHILIRAVGEYFFLNFNNYNFKALNIKPSIEVYPFENVGIGASYQYFSANIKKDPVGTFHGEFKYGFSAASLFLSLRF